MTAAGVHVFGVRHLSPGGAWHLRATLDAVRPKVVLVEGLTDAAALIPDLTRSGTNPPVAILAYTDAVPVRTLVYPLATYSPEYQALVWAKENKARAEFIDLERTAGLPVGEDLPHPGERFEIGHSLSFS